MPIGLEDGNRGLTAMVDRGSFGALFWASGTYTPGMATGGLIMALKASVDWIFNWSPVFLSFLAAGPSASLDMALQTGSGPQLWRFLF